MGNVENSEMIRTFNCGLGMILIVSPENQAEVMNMMRNHGAMVVGNIQARPVNGARVVVDNFSSALELVRRLPILPKKRVYTFFYWWFEFLRY
jgi:phosphoribosylamine--glycine ligase / phosphoribosylglycinamide formyltransferase / phosphoribosylformylglycinamidine cyclo-ligase